MNGLSGYFYISIFSAALLLCVMGLWFTAIVPGIDRWSKRFFICFFIVFVFCCLMGFADIFVSYYPVPRPVRYFVMFLECLLLSMPLPMLTVYLLHSCGESMRRSRLLHIVLGCWAVYIIIMLLACDPFIGVFSYVTENNTYYRGPLYPLLVLPLVSILILTLGGVMSRRNRLSRRVYLSMLIAIIPVTAALIIQMFDDVFPLIDISYVLSALVMYGLVLSDQIDNDRRQQQEIANQQASIMVLQMRPHFIYNTMTSIYCLCDQDPQLARQVIMNFTTYLRKNFTAIASDTLIPFSSELEHTRAYLAVEQAMYEDSLSVDYDTPHTWFRVPPLTLQPIVENAVKHGRDPYAGPFHISVRTRKTDSGSEIIVSDNGRGFDPADNGEPHIALGNIRQRLEIMCGGRMTITSGEGGGTVVTLTIPDSALKENGQ